MDSHKIKGKRKEINSSTLGFEPFISTQVYYFSILTSQSPQVYMRVTCKCGLSGRQHTQEQPPLPLTKAAPLPHLCTCVLFSQLRLCISSSCFCDKTPDKTN